MEQESPRHLSGAFSLLRAVKDPYEETVDQPRPRMLTWLCVASFINQGVVFPLYLAGMLVSQVIRDMPPEELREMVEETYALFIQPDQREQMITYLQVLQANGLALMGVYALRTLARFIGTLRMWQGHRDGFHIYTSAQLLGILVPLLIVGPISFSFLGFVLALNWCYLYFVHRKALK